MLTFGAKSRFYIDLIYDSELICLLAGKWREDEREMKRGEKGEGDREGRKKREGTGRRKKRK